MKIDPLLTGISGLRATPYLPDLNAPEIERQRESPLANLVLPTSVEPVQFVERKYS